VSGNRLALAGCKEATEGPWTLAKGNERELKISGLKDGEHIELQVLHEDSTISFWHVKPGVFPFPQILIKKYRVVKHVSNGFTGSPTHVEIILESR